MRSGQYKPAVPAKRPPHPLSIYIYIYIYIRAALGTPLTALRTGSAKQEGVGSDRISAVLGRFPAELWPRKPGNRPRPGHCSICTYYHAAPDANSKAISWHTAGLVVFFFAHIYIYICIYSSAGAPWQVWVYGLEFKV